MPIKLNLLAEAQAAEEMRRRDPVKRALIIGALLVGLMLLWASSLMLKSILATKEVDKIETQTNTRTNEYQVVVNSQRKSGEITRKLMALRSLATNRFLHGNILDALQHATADDVQMSHLKIDQTYLYIEEVKSKTNDDKVVPGKPAVSVENILVTIEAKDSCSSPGDQIGRFREVLTTNSYFQSVLGKTNEVRLVNYQPPQSSPDSRPFVLFTVECRYPERRR